ncbi:MAG TPA: glycine cleavage system aminomethyltransferase GcvT [Candidatus Dormibacteraeota bacterium]|nr:glycine cleavage system aminomethyltransferase GcvT [Candidatus Dormibacteraeota bacterium]
MGRHTPLYDRHLAAGARMVDFAGYDMPLQYTGIRDEHVAVRERAGIFDVSHMGEVLVSGGGASSWLQHLVTNDVARLHDEQALYTVMCHDDGGIIDDLLVYRRDADHFMVIVNAATREKDVAWMREHGGDEAGLRDVSDDVALLAVQGPRSVDILEPITKLDGGEPLRGMKPFASSGATIGGITGSTAQRISRTGYTGEDGFEIVIDSAAAGALWDAILDAGEKHGLVPAGLGARDTLRLEAGLRLYGQDMDDDTDPYSCALGWTVKLDKGDFIGAEALRGLRESPPRRFVGLRLGPRTIARHGQAVLQDGREMGVVTSGTFGFTVGTAVATASVLPDFERDDGASVDIRGTSAAAQVVPLPFYKRPKGDG